jgi:hypothetical protein
MLLVAAAIGSAAWILVREPVRVPELPAGHYTPRLAACTPAEQTEKNYTEAGVAACLTEVLLAAEAVDSLQRARLDLGEMVRNDPWLHNYCHLAEHQTGASIMREPGRVPELLHKHPENTCSWGIGHGLLETFGAVRPDERHWQAVLGACRELRSMPDPYPEVYALCADGVGHAAWDHHRDVTGAARRCLELLEASGVSACAAGVMMQQYRPAETGKQPPFDPNELVSYCARTWPGGSRAGTEGCATGVGYVLSLSLVGDAVSEALNDGRGDDTAVSAGREGLLRALGICATQSGWVDTCEASVIANLPRHLLTGNGDLTDLCNGTGLPRERCPG